MIGADRLSWTIARHVADMPRGTVFAAAPSAIAGIRLSQEMLGCQLALCGRGGAYDARGILSLHARHWLFNRRPRAHVTLQGVFDTLSEPHALFTTPAQLDGAGDANLSTIGDHTHPKVAFGGTRGLPDAGTIHFVLPLHSARQLVERVDFVSTSAASRPVAALLFTERCVMRWAEDPGLWRLQAIAPGVEAAALQRETGFRFEAPDRVDLLEEPPTQARALLEQIDPLHVRELDFITDRIRSMETLARIYAQEVALVDSLLKSGRSIAPQAWQHAEHDKPAEH
jgi:hypothetical protein